MVKRISCRVISSAVFSKTGLGAPSVKHPNDRQHEIGDIVATTVNPKAINSPVRNTDTPDIVLGAPDFSIGQILDYYA